MLRIYTIILILLLSFPLLSQNISLEKKKAEIKIENQDYDGAINVYLDLLKVKLVDYGVYTSLGYCYLQIGDYDKAINFLEKSSNYYRSLEYFKKVDALNAMYFLATTYMKTYEFEKAKNLFIKLKDYSNKKQIVELDKRIIQCDSAKKMFENPKGFFVFQPGIINSEYPDYCPVMSIAQNKMYFTSRRPGSTGGQKDIDGYEFEDIYSVDVKDGDFSKPVNIGSPINTENHEATSSISADGQKMFIYKSTNKDPGDIYVSELINDKWSVPIRMESPVNSKASETHAAVSPDGQHLYFTSDRNGGYGGLDIYQAVLSASGKWIDITNMGPDINTPEDEEGPFLSPDGNTMYFSSTGHVGMGGFDIYKCVKGADRKWSTPVNMGFPLNTSNDDIFFVPTNNPGQAFYSSKQVGGVSSILVVQLYDNLDNMIFVSGYTMDSEVRNLSVNNIVGDSILYNNEMYPFDKRVSVENDTFHVFHYNGNSVIDSVIRFPKNTTIKVYKVSDNSLVGNYTPSLLGKYGVPINTLEKYVIYFTAPGYAYNIYQVDGKPGAYYFNAEMDTLIKGKENIVKYTNFDKDSIKLSDAQKIELDILADYLNKNDNLRVDISSYGYYDIPENLDSPRNKAITNYLTEKGVNGSKMFKNLSPDIIRDDKVQYTVYDKNLINKEEKQKDQNYVAKSAKIIHGTLVDDVHFEINMSDNPEFYDDLNILAKFLIKNKEAKIGVYGYTDTQGPSDYNKALAKKRADFVKNYLVKQGVNSDQVVAEGRGYSKQISVNKNNQGNYEWNSLGFNRRVEIEILHQGEYEKLFVKPIDVPDQFQINISGNTYFYSVNIVSSMDKIPNTAFDFDVTELHTVDGVYNYVSGEFEHEYEAENFVNKIKSKYPKAFVFINNFRK